MAFFISLPDFRARFANHLHDSALVFSLPFKE
jgi:hypothetical protein